MAEKLEKTAYVSIAADYIKGELRGLKPRVGLILGSGLSAVADAVQDATRVPYGMIPGFTTTTVEGHTGCLVLGSLKGIPVMVMQGRFHYYEGHSMDVVTLPVRLMRALGVDTLIVTNAGGGVNPSFTPGDIMLITDHINRLPNPLRGPNDDSFGPRFPSMHAAYTPELRDLAFQCALRLGLHLQQGCYLSTEGPSFETPHEYEYFRLIGADAVGMSTTPEVIVAVHGGMRVLGFSVIANVGGLSQRSEVTHEEVQRLGAKAGEQLTRLLLEIVPNL